MANKAILTANDNLQKTSDLCCYERDFLRGYFPIQNLENI